MDPLDQRNTIEQLLEQEKKCLDVVRIASVTPKDKDPVFATSVAWLIHNGYIPRMSDHQRGKLVLPVHWVQGYLYQSTDYCEYLGLSGYDARHDYCSLRGDDLDQDLPSWEAKTELLGMKPKTIQRIVGLVFKLISELLVMTRFPSRDRGPWEKLIGVQDLAIAIQQRFVAAKDSIELVLEALKKAIPGNVEALRSHETGMRNFLDLNEHSTFSSKCLAEDKHLNAWIKFM